MNTDVDIPVSSVRQFISTGHDVHFLDGGGSVQHSDSEAKIRFMELGNVYFMEKQMSDVYDGGHAESGVDRPAHKRCSPASLCYNSAYLN